MMTANGAKTKRVALLIENGVEDSEFQVPYNALKQAGFDVVVLGSRTNEKYLGKQGKLAMQADGTTTEAMPADFDAVLIPGGMAPDMMRTNPNTVQFVREAFEQGKIVAAVCHGPQVLIKASMQGTDETFLLRSTLGDLQTGIVDINNLRVKFTDPVTTAILTEIESDLSKCEQAVAKLYRDRASSQEIKAPKPSTSPALNS
ncbi:MAG: hypothetical protein HC942_24345 [Microcoleus sp. SU_5_6]|nr:hypothetical protein [Microcoleus sp. SU_5_6]NJL68754.1 hypothetical protein [Microcoleus sp. SM1_3_4]